MQSVTETWTKFRTLMRRAAASASGVDAPAAAHAPSPPPPHGAAVPPPIPSASAAAPGAPAADQVRELRDGLAATRQWLDQIGARLDAIERGARTTDGAVAGLATRGELEMVARAVADVRETAARLESTIASSTVQLTGLADRTTRELAKVGAIDAAQRSIDERLAESDLRTREMQAAIEMAEQTTRATRQELLDREALRDRELNGRLAGLYIIGFVALTAALATLVLYLNALRS